LYETTTTIISVSQADEDGVNVRLARFSRDSMKQLLERNPRVAALLYQVGVIIFVEIVIF
jgi:hypothetical protein